MSNNTHLQEFPLFSSLSTEIRLLIWTHTFTPRILSLHATNLTDSIAQANNLFMILRSRRAPTLSLSDKQERLSREIRLTLVSVKPILALLSVCHESRNLVLNSAISGYQFWTLPCGKNGEIRDVLWNPGLDTVAFVGPHTHEIPLNYTHMLQTIHPTQTTLIQNLALPTTNWQPFQGSPGGHRGSNGSLIEIEPPSHATRFSAFPNLKNLIVIIDDLLERRFVERLSRGRMGHGSFVPNRRPFQIPEDIQMSLRRCKELTIQGEGSEVHCNWEVPGLRVVRDESEEALLGEENIRMVLRCFPCPDLGIEDWGLRTC